MEKYSFEDTLKKVDDSTLSLTVDPGTSGLITFRAICNFEAMVKTWTVIIAFNKPNKGSVSVFPETTVLGDDLPADLKINSGADNIDFSVSAPDGAEWKFTAERNLF